MPNTRSHQGSRLDRSIRAVDSGPLATPAHGWLRSGWGARRTSVDQRVAQLDLWSEACSAVANHIWVLESDSVVLIVDSAGDTFNINAILQASGLTVLKGFDCAEFSDNTVVIVDQSTWEMRSFQSRARQFDHKHPKVIFCVLTGTVSHDQGQLKTTTNRLLESLTPDARAVLTALGIEFYMPTGGLYAV
jgi:hypothetical protein